MPFKRQQPSGLHRQDRDHRTPQTLPRFVVKTRSADAVPQLDAAGIVVPPRQTATDGNHASNYSTVLHFSSSSFARRTIMHIHDLRQPEVTWQALLNAPEAKVLDATAERALLVEIHNCRERLLSGLAWPAEGQGRTTLPLAEFQQRVRELASSTAALDSRSLELRSVAIRYQEIRTSLAMANVRLVAHIAKRYHGRGIPHGDLIQEGVCALLLAIDRFDVANETRLATYAIWWIRQGIQRAVAAGAYPVRLNPRQLQQLARAHVAVADLEQGRAPRDDKSSSAASHTIERLLAATRPVLSLDASSGSDGTSAIVDFFIPPDDEVDETEDLNEQVGNLIETLDLREQQVLKLRYGLRGGPRYSLVQVGRVLGVSKERVRQLQDRALRKLRAAHDGTRISRRRELAASC